MESADLSLRAPRDDEEARALGRIVFQALAPPSYAVASEGESILDSWLNRTRASGEMRVVERGGAIAGGAVIVPFEQFFGGRLIPSGGVTAVAIAPEHRGHGVALWMMRAIVRELHAKGTPLSALYPASHALYRGAGYELAGQHTIHRVPTHLLSRAATDPALEVRRLDPERDLPTLRALYATQMRHHNGPLDRGPFLWRQLLAPLRGKPFAYVIERAGAPEGYVVFTHREEPTIRYDLVVTDLVATTTTAFDRLVAFLAAHGSVAPYVEYAAAPADPVLYRARESTPYAIKQRIDWMLRVVDLPKALVARGWPRGVRRELHLAVHDAEIEANEGRFVLEVADGEARVSAGGRGDLRIDARAMATLFSGHLSPWELARMDRLSASEDVLADAATLFAGPAPWMPDMF